MKTYERADLRPSQIHNYAMNGFFAADVKISHVNLNDNTISRIECKSVGVSASVPSGILSRTADAGVLFEEFMSGFADDIRKMYGN